MRDELGRISNFAHHLHGKQIFSDMPTCLCSLIPIQSSSLMAVSKAAKAASVFASQWVRMPSLVSAASPEATHALCAPSGLKPEASLPAFVCWPAFFF
jgi:hypothetical protein